MNMRTARRVAQWEALGVPDTRGSRFANRLVGIEGPTFADLAAVPRWLMLTAEEQARIAMAAGLLQYKGALDRELSGQKLSALADFFGETLVDAVAALPSVELTEANSLPPPETLVAQGWSILQRGLPAPFATHFSQAANDPDARALAEAAFNLVQRL
jgi:hypothetical protein